MGGGQVVGGQGAVLEAGVVSGCFSLKRRDMNVNLLGAGGKGAAADAAERGGGREAGSGQGLGERWGVEGGCGHLCSRVGGRKVRECHREAGG